jgi:hypothetical protein
VGPPPQAAALVALVADACQVWDAIVVWEYERAFYGSQYALMAPLFEHYGVQLWMPEAGGRIDFASEHDEQAMTMLGLSSKREVTRTSIRVRTALAVQTREQGRYLGGRQPFGYRLGDAGRSLSFVLTVAHPLALADLQRLVAGRQVGHAVTRCTGLPAVHCGVGEDRSSCMGGRQ